MCAFGRIIAVAGVVTLALGAGARAQPNCMGRADFDACMAGFVANQQAQNAAQQQAIFRQYLAVYGPWLQGQYAQYRAQGGPMSFEQFAYWNMMTANGTNVAGAAEAQRQQFEASQRANRTVQEGHASYNEGSRQNSQRMEQAAGRYSTEAIRGQSPYVDPRTGQTVLLPTNVAPGQPFNWGGEAYVRDQAGNFHRRDGNGWVPLQPR